MEKIKRLIIVSLCFLVVACTTEVATTGSSNTNFEQVAEITKAQQIQNVYWVFKNNPTYIDNESMYSTYFPNYSDDVIARGVILYRGE